MRPPIEFDFADPDFYQLLNNNCKKRANKKGQSFCSFDQTMFNLINYFHTSLNLFSSPKEVNKVIKVK